jgi:hypothetical protein
MADGALSRMMKGTPLFHESAWIGLWKKGVMEGGEQGGASPLLEKDDVMARKNCRIERTVEQRTDAEAEAICGYCLAARSALTDDGRPPLAAPGLKLHARISAIAASLTRVSEKGACRVS